MNVESARGGQVSEEGILSFFMKMKERSDTTEPRTLVASGAAKGG